MNSSTQNILVLNAGSSSTKVSLFQFDKAPTTVAAQEPVWQSEIDYPSGSNESIDWQTRLNGILCRSESHPPAVRASGSMQSTPTKPAINIVGHRVVHGGEKYWRSTIVDDEVKQDIKDCIKLAPLHNKISLAQIEAMEKLLPANTKQVVVFDTAFHHDLPDPVKFYPLPYNWYEKYGIRRFGFHGINQKYCAQQTAHLLGRELSSLSIIVCHLGAGSSLAAIENGKSVNTTMGFTPMDGLMMASRCGSIDPGIMLYLLKNENMTADQLDEALNKNSGLKGISQIGSDMKTIIEKMNSDNENEKRFCKLAFDMFIEHLRSSICAMRASLKRLDALIFTGGIGEHSDLVRKRTCAGLEFLGLDPHAILVIKAREDWAIAQECLHLM